MAATATLSTPATSSPSIVSAVDPDANAFVAAVATFCSTKPTRASSTTGSDSHWPIVSPTVCKPRWWLSSWASTPVSSRRGSSSRANVVTTTRWPPHA